MVLFGAELSYANLNVDKYEFEAETKSISPFNKKILTLYILKLLVKNFQKGEAPSTPGGNIKKFTDSGQPGSQYLK